jgi:hypothetical protein
MLVRDRHAAAPVFIGDRVINDGEKLREVKKQTTREHEI